MKGPGAILFDVDGNPVTILPDGSVAVTILDGYVTLSGDDVISVSNFPATQPVSGAVSVSNFPATQPVDGTVSVDNFPATQPVSGTVAVSNFPASQVVSVSNFPAFPATQAVSGTVAVSNFPATQPVSIAAGTNVNNFPAIQPVSGTVAVSNFPAFPAIQAVSQSGAPWTVLTNKASTSTVAQITPSTSVQTLLAANASRVSAVLFNGGNKSLFVKLGAGATLTSYTDVVLSASSYEIPNTYTGIITGIWAAGVAATPVLQATELLP